MTFSSSSSFSPKNEQRVHQSDNKVCRVFRYSQALQPSSDLVLESCLRYPQILSSEKTPYVYLWGLNIHFLVRFWLGLSLWLGQNVPWARNTIDLWCGFPWSRHRVFSHWLLLTFLDGRGLSCSTRKITKWKECIRMGWEPAFLQNHKDMSMNLKYTQFGL